MSKFGDKILSNVLSLSSPWLGGAAALALAAGAAHAAATAQVASGEPLPAGAGYVQVAGLFGDDEEEQEAQQHEQTQDAAQANLTQRVNDLEESLRQLTGQVEEANHRADELQQRMIRMQKDFDYKLCTISAQQLGASSEGGDQSQGDQTQNALPCNPAGADQSPPAQSEPPPAQNVLPSGPAPGPSVTPGRQTNLAPPPGVLGTLPQGTPIPKPSPGPAAAAPATAPATSGNRGQFDAAMNLLARAQYDEARGAFRSFADANPKDDLAPQAVYWIGDIAYVQKDYPGAARAFAEEIKKYPTSARAPESMLKLGQSLIAMNQKEEGCTALGALSGKYPKASKTVLRQAREARKQSGCR